MSFFSKHLDNFAASCSYSISFCCCLIDWDKAERPAALPSSWHAQSGAVGVEGIKVSHAEQGEAGWALTLRVIIL